MHSDNNRRGKQGEISISQLLVLLLGLVVILFIFNLGFRTFCLNLIDVNSSPSKESLPVITRSAAEKTASEQTAEKQSNVSACMGHLNSFFKMCSSTGLMICDAYISSWSAGINSSSTTAEEYLQVTHEIFESNSSFRDLERNLKHLKSFATFIDKNGSDAQRALIADCVGTISELADLAKQPRGTFISYNNSVEKLKSKIARLNGQLDVATFAR